jgi:AhpD family alkylhydroperoxidase
MGFETRTDLTPQEREIVALGASVGCGCRSCVSYHVDAGRKAGLSSNQLAEIVLLAHRVAIVAGDRIARQGLSLIQAADGGQATQPVSQRAAALAALGSAIAANSMPDIEEHLAGASREGLSSVQLAHAVSVAQDVQGNAASIHARKTARMVELAATDHSSNGEALGAVLSAGVSSGASDAVTPLDDASASQRNLATDTPSVPDESGEDCGCGKDPASEPDRGPSEDAAVRPSPDESHAVDGRGGIWGSMLAMMGSDSRALLSCCPRPTEHDGAGAPTTSAEAGCGCASDSASRETSHPR